jgi:flagellin-like hook-associated protein FlgL
MRFDSNGKIIDQSAFNISLPGISFLGYGKNADGIPNNIYTLIGKIADGLDRSDYSYESIQPYIKNLEQQQEKLMTNVTGIGVQSDLLASTKTRLESSELNLNEKISDVEYIDPAEAIMDFKMQEYSYRAALQMGTLILQPTFLDFMK